MLLAVPPLRAPHIHTPEYDATRRGTADDPVVYVLHEPVRWDRDQRRMVPIDLTRARTYGRLKVVFPGTDRPPPITECVDRLRAAMAEFRPWDRLLIAGDMDLLAFAAVLAARAAGGNLTLLKWHTRDRAYEEVKAPPGLLS